MFAVVEILNQKLYATALPDGDDSFTKCFRQWQDPMYVRQYLQSQPSTHEFYHVGLKEASKIVLRESNYLIKSIKF